MRIFRMLPLALVCLVGCGGPPLAGKWNMSAAGSPPGSKLVTEFMADTFKVDVEFEQGGMKMKFDFSGDYTYDGKKLKMVGKTVHIDESSLPAAVKGQLPMIKSSLEKTVLTTQEGDAKLEGDTLTFTEKGKVTTFTKIK